MAWTWDFFRSSDRRLVAVVEFVCPVHHISVVAMICHHFVVYHWATYCFCLACPMTASLHLDWLILCSSFWSPPKAIKWPGLFMMEKFPFEKCSFRQASHVFQIDRAPGSNAKQSTLTSLPWETHIYTPELKRWLNKETLDQVWSLSLHYWANRMPLNFKWLSMCKENFSYPNYFWGSHHVQQENIKFCSKRVMYANRPKSLNY